MVSPIARIRTQMAQKRRELNDDAPATVKAIMTKAHINT
jgi:hypothetical protein